MNKTVYALIIIRRYKNIGDTATILTFNSKEDAEKYAADKADADMAARELSTAIIEMMVCYNGDNYPPSVNPISFGASLKTTIK